MREADAIVRDEIRRAGLERELWQVFAVLPPIRSVGVMGDAAPTRTPIAIRAVTSRGRHDGRLGAPALRGARRRSRRGIVNEVDGVNRVVYDITSQAAGDHRMGVIA